MGKELYTLKQFLDAVPGSGGTISAISDRVGCEWETTERYRKKYKTLDQAIQAEKEVIDDTAVSVMTENIKLAQALQKKTGKPVDSGDAKWWLARKRRGEFGDNVDVTTKGERVKGYVVISPDDWDEDG